MPPLFIMNPYKAPKISKENPEDWVDKESPKRYNKIVDWSDLLFFVSIIFLFGIFGVLLFMRV